ncbi:hypothetical protein, conserved [Eimeria necatrix]|uniref:Uncharacterized protein n=1 Tax=Eimeria necatrix TaxID=51315 RepID=U6MK01_9EIME|nr:hypothetical protein, conserved [Eimeria necatrix]CDJ61985.1 hypothetical protein, conserved [Eimeria necatrix]
MSSPATSKNLCSRCHSYFDEKDESDKCVFHPKTFVCRYHPEGDKYYAAVELNASHKGWHGYCWECCGSEDKDAPGCASGPHTKY